MHLLEDITQNLLRVLQQLPPDYYSKQLPILDKHTIGQQVRHVIEHWQILIENYNAAEINYGDRKREQILETDKELAIRTILDLLNQSHKNDTPLCIRSMDNKEILNSTYLRELDSVAEHIIHHAAIIKIALLSLDENYVLPPDFGYAPSTVLHKQKICVQ